MSDRSGEGASAERLADLEANVEALRRVNAELGRELRRGGASRQPRSPAVAARALAKLANERDTARAELEHAKAELEQVRAGLAATQAELARAERGIEDLGNRLEGLHVETEHLRHEAVRLRAGWSGLLRRLRARFLRR